MRVIWSIWIDLGYNVDAYEEIGFSSIEVSDMEKVAQYQLFKIAEDILREFVYGDDDGFRWLNGQYRQRVVISHAETRTEAWSTAREDFKIHKTSETLP